MGHLLANWLENSFKFLDKAILRFLLSQKKEIFIWNYNIWVNILLHSQLVSKIIQLMEDMLLNQALIAVNIELVYDFAIVRDVVWLFDLIGLF
jgi:hypothetical protein